MLRGLSSASSQRTPSKGVMRSAMSQPLERGDRDDAQLAGAAHREPRYDVMQVVRLAHTHRDILGLFRDARSITVEMRGITQLLRDSRVGVAERAARAHGQQVQIQVGTQVPVLDALAGRGIRLHPLDTGLHRRPVPKIILQAPTVAVSLPSPRTNSAVISKAARPAA